MSLVLDCLTKPCNEINLGLFQSTVTIFNENRFETIQHGSLANKQECAFVPPPSDFFETFSENYCWVPLYFWSFDDDARKTRKESFLYVVPKEVLVIAVTVLYHQSFWTIQSQFRRAVSCKCLTSRSLVTFFFEALIAINSNVSH